jgi:hypothetical protein
MVEFRKDICCIIFNYNNYTNLYNKFDKMAKVACDSFKKHHPNIKLFFIDKNNINDMISEKTIKMHVGYMRYMACYEICKKYGYRRFIILGADTITCDTLTEFIDNTEYDIITSLDYPYKLESGGFTSPGEDTHVNADVVCFNNLDALLGVIKLISKHTNAYYEQGALNEFIWTNNDFKFKIVDAPYHSSSVVYNTRSKGNISAGPGQKPWKPYIQKFYVKNDKLYTHEDKQIKVFHYCEGFGGLQKQDFLNLINLWILDWFNDETKNFFKEKCNSGNFFEEKYEL